MLGKVVPPNPGGLLTGSDESPRNHKEARHRAAVMEEKGVKENQTEGS